MVREPARLEREAGVKIDAFTHFVPPDFRDVVVKELGESRAEFGNWTSLQPLVDIVPRLEVMDAFDIDVQVLCMPPPPLEFFFDQAAVQDLQRRANDSLAEVVREHPSRFLGVATATLLDPEAAATELERCVTELGLKGVMVYASSQATPLDAPELDDFYDVVETLEVPIWIHPERSRSRPDYERETESRYGLYLVFGWPYESSIAMARVVIGGVFERHPRLKVITHHAGAMIPPLAKRIALHYPDDEKLPRVDVPSGTAGVLDRFRTFYADTVATGSTTSLLSSLEFFGAERMIFASDYPFGPRSGRRFVEEAVGLVESLPIAEEEKSAIWGKNAARIFKTEPGR